MRAHPPSMGGKSTRRLFTPSEFPVSSPPPSGPLLFPPFSLLAFPLGLSARAMPAFSRSLQWRPRRCSTTSTVVVKAVVEFVAGNDEKGRGEYFPSWVVVGRQPFKHFYVFFFLQHSFTLKAFVFESLCEPIFIPK